MRWLDRALAAAAFLTLCLVAGVALAQTPGNFSTLSTTGTAVFGGDALMCSGRPWIDVRCNGAVGDDKNDDTSAIQTTIDTAIANGWPVYLSPGTYKVSSKISIDYAGQAANGFRLISAGATLDGRSIASGPVLQVLCSGGTVASPAACFYFNEQGTLFIQADSGETNLATLTAGYGAGTTVLGVSTTTPFTVGSTILIALANGTTVATPISAIGSGTITISAPGLPSPADANAQVSVDSYPFTMGKTDFSDQHNSFKIDHLVVNNASTSPGAGGCQFNAVYDSDIYAICDSAGGAAGIALEQTQFSRVSGAGSAAGTGGSALTLENGYNYADIFYGLDLENAPTCLSITFDHDGENTFISPYFSCTTAVNAPSSTHNVLINPTYSSAVVNRGPQSQSIQIIGTGNRVPWQFPTAATFVASGVDSGTVLSSYNAPGTSLAVSLPSPAAVENGWWMGFATDNGKGLTITAPSGLILSGSKPVSTLTLGAGNYEYVALQSDGTNFRVIDATRNTRIAAGFEAVNFPGNWLYPSTSGYAATLADNGNVLSSFDTASGLSVTLPSTAGLPTGWSMGFATDNNKSVTIAVNGTDGGHILWPGSGDTATSLSLADTSQGAYEFLVLQYDGGGDFRVEDATPATAQAIGVIGAGGLSHWSFPATSAYQATQADNGNVVSSFDSPLSYMTVTLPPANSIGMGWTVGLATDNGKTMAVEVNATDGGHILYPGSTATTSSVSLAPGTYEFLALQFDGDNFRVVQATPATAAAIGMTGATVGPRWSFPASGTYGASALDNGNTVSSFNSPGGSLTVTLPPTTAIAADWTMGFATDANNALTIDVNGTSGGDILVPGTLGGTGSITLAPGNYEDVELEFDGSNFRVVQATPATANALGMFPQIGTPASSSAACETGRMEADSNYLYFCTSPNTWKRAAWSSF